jgi:hypothetical protein
MKAKKRSAYKGRREYQDQSGHRELASKFNNQNDNAWKIKVVKNDSGVSYEIVFAPSSLILANNCCQLIRR